MSALLSLLGIPVVLIVDQVPALTATPLAIGATGVAVLAGVFYLTYKLLFARLPSHAHDAYLAWFVLFAFTSVVDLLIAIEIDFDAKVADWYVHVMLGLADVDGCDVCCRYLNDGERYLKGPWGGAANWWDATTHWVLYV